MLIMLAYRFFVWFIVVIMLKESQACFTQSQNHTILRRKGVTFYQECVCQTPGYNGRHIKWVDSHNQEIDVLRPGTDQKAYTERQSDRVNLYIPTVTKALSGLYRCVTNFEGQDYSQNFYIEAYEPVTINPPEEQFILLGNRSLVKCKVHAENMSNILISWSKIEEDERRISLTNNDKYDITDDGLYINDVVDEDKGKYSCSIYDEKNLDEVDKDINVKIMIKPTLKDLVVVPDSTLVVGDTLIMKCVADGIPHPEYIWRRTDTGEMDNPRWKKQDNAIMIDQVLPEDQGEYECIAQSMAGVVSESVDIKVFVPPNITSFNNIEGVEGSTVQLVCNANGRPAPNISIVYIGKDEDEIKTFEVDDIKENLSFIRLERSHEGFYVCNASNEVNFTLEEMYLTVHYKPKFEVIEEIVWGWEGRLVNMTCVADGKPPPEIKWRVIGENMPITVNVEQNILPKFFYNADPRYVLINVTEMTRSLYLTYECDATNDLGSDTKRIHFMEGHVPPPVKNASAKSITATSATFYIEQSEYFQGPQIHGYIAEYDLEDNYNITSIHENRTWSVERPFTVNNLKPNSSYLIRFAAINIVGYGGWSDYMEFITREPSPPSTPIWEMVSELSSDNSLNVTEINQAISWRLSDNSGAPVDYYTLKYCPIYEEKSCKEQKVKSDSELKADMTILDQNTTYLIELVAHNYVGYSTPANITITTPAKIISQARLSAGALIGISVVVVFLCLLVLDLLLLLWRRQGIMATCCCKKEKNKMTSNLQIRDKKGLLKDSHDESERSRNNRPKEYEYNKTTGIITGKHSAV